MKKLLVSITMVVILVCFSFPSTTPSTTFAATTQIKGSDVMIIGDSFFALSHEITSSLEKQVKDAGVLGADDHFRDCSVSGATLKPDGYVTDIPQQYKNALSSGKVKYVIMDGGGNDCLQGNDAPPYNENTPYIKNATTAVNSLLKEMKADGIVKVFYLFYPNPNGDLGGLKGKLDVLRPIMQSTVANAAKKPETDFFDVIPVWDGHLAEYTKPDGIHPTTAGSEATAKAMWSEMQKTNFLGTSTPPIKYGDINGDNRVNTLDYLLLKRYLAHNVTELSGNGTLAADVNGDGTIDLNDYALLRDYLLRKIDHFPLE